MLLGVWAVICLLQAFFTELHPDEAYYWVYSQNIEWGHFHQPPMIALFIKLGYYLFENELGVRLLTILANIATIKMLYSLCSAQKPFVFWATISSLFLLHAHSLLAVPDSPLIFFCTLFLWYYKKVDEKIGAKQSIVLGLIGLAILYSKYHGILFLGVFLLLNLKQLKNPFVYIIIAITTLGYIPHIMWQIEHDWAAIRFHLFNRELVPYSPSWISLFVGTQILLLVPLGLIVVYGAIKSRETLFQIKMQRMALIIFCFLLILSFRNRVEANWIAMAYIPLIIAGYPYLEKLNTRLVIWLAIPAVALFSTARIELATRFINPNVDLNFRYAYYENWANQIKKKAHGKPVVFANSYQSPSLYMFYTGDVSHSVNRSFHPGNQYDFYTFSSAFDGQDVLEVGGFEGNCTDYIEVEGDSLCVRELHDFRSFQGIWFDMSLDSQYETEQSDSITIYPTNKLDFTPDLSQRADGQKPIIAFSWVNENGDMHVDFANVILQVSDFGGEVKVPFRTPKTPGKYTVGVGISSLSYYPIRNSYFYTVEIK